MKDEQMWKKYEVKLQMLGKFAASLPKSKEEVKAMLEHRMPANPPPDFIPIDKLVDEVVEKVGVVEAEGEEDEEVKFGWATFCRNEEGLYYEGRCVRGHIKDCANQIKDLLAIKAFKAKVSNKVYVMTDVIPLGVKEPAGIAERFVQVMTRLGPRSTIKYVDYLEKPALRFQLYVLSDAVITEDILKGIFDYGSVHGMGQERSQGWGRYTFTISEIALKPRFAGVELEP